jgi:aminoglycoside 3-N-acetyltransferase
MHTQQDIMRDMAHLGILPSDSVLVHTSLKSIGATENGADTVLDAFCAYLSTGLLVMPGHTWATINAQNPEFAVSESPVCVGVLPELFRKRNGVHRSLHPTHSLLAYGRDAEQFARGEEKFDTPCAPDSCYGKLEKRGGKVLFIGVDFRNCTMVHCIEEVAHVPGRLTDTWEPLRVKKGDGTVVSVPSRRHEHSNSEYFKKLEPVLQYRNVLTKGKIGDAQAMVCKIQDLFRVTLELLRRNPGLFDDNEPVPKEWF